MLYNINNNYTKLIITFILYNILVFLHYSSWINVYRLFVQVINFLLDNPSQFYADLHRKVLFKIITKTFLQKQKLNEVIEKVCVNNRYQI